MFNIRTDLALEAKEIYENDQKSTEIPGVKVKNKDLENCKVSIVEVIDEQGSKIMNKGIGKYVTLESNLMKFDDDESREEMITYLKDELVEILGSDKTKKTLVIGLGNWNITSDALGPKSVSKTLVTRHIFKNYNKDYDDDFTEVSALSPGVMGITGLETSETVKSIVDMIKPDRVIAIDALASRKMERVNSTIQISTAGISPGGGVGNKRKALNKDYLGVDVIAIGVPTVVDAATLTSDVLDLAIDMSVGCNKNQLIGYATHGSPVSPPPFIAGFVETEIDKETGKVEIIDYVAVVDCGTVINKNLAKIQVEGGIVQGIGMALYEDVVYTQRGELASNTFMQYKMPTRKDVGNIIVDFEESYEPTGPFGAKSVGEVVVNTPSPAIENAIYNGLGINLNTLPMTPEKVFMAMTNK